MHYFPDGNADVLKEKRKGGRKVISSQNASDVTDWSYTTKETHPCFFFGGKIDQPGDVIGDMAPHWLRGDFRAAMLTERVFTVRRLHVYIAWSTYTG